MAALGVGLRIRRERVDPRVLHIVGEPCRRAVGVRHAARELHKRVPHRGQEEHRKGEELHRPLLAVEVRHNKRPLAGVGLLGKAGATSRAKYD